MPILLHNTSLQGRSEGGGGHLEQSQIGAAQMDHELVRVMSCICGDVSIFSAAFKIIFML